MKIKPELAYFINAWERLGSKIDFAYVIIDMEFIERYFDYYNLSGEEVEQIALTLAESEYRCIELLAYLVGVGKSWSEFREAFHGYMFDIGDQTLIVTPKCKYPYSYSYETKKCDCSRRRKNIRIFDSDKVCLDAPLSYLLDISKALSGYEYRGCAVVHDELQEFVWEFLDTFDECDGEEGLFIGSNSYELLDGYVTLRGAARLININPEKAIKQFNFHLKLEGGDINLTLTPNGKCWLEADIKQYKPEIERKEVELLTRTIRHMIPSWIKIEKVSEMAFPRKIDFFF